MGKDQNIFNIWEVCSEGAILKQSSENLDVWQVAINSLNSGHMVKYQL